MEETAIKVYYLTDVLLFNRNTIVLFIVKQYDTAITLESSLIQYGYVFMPFTDKMLQLTISPQILPKSWEF